MPLLNPRSLCANSLRSNPNDVAPFPPLPPNMAEIPDDMKALCNTFLIGTRLPLNPVPALLPRIREYWSWSLCAFLYWSASRLFGSAARVPEFPNHEIHCLSFFTFFQLYRSYICDLNLESPGSSRKSLTFLVAGPLTRNASCTALPSRLKAPSRLATLLAASLASSLTL